MFQEKYGKTLKEIPADLMSEIRPQVKKAILSALSDTANRNVNLNVFMAKRPYKYPVGDCFFLGEGKRRQPLGVAFN